MRTKEERYNIKKSLIKMQGCCCYKCGLDMLKQPQGMAHFHHIESDTKVANIADMIIRDRLYTITDIMEESEKTILMCAKCHMIFHKKYGYQVTEDNIVDYLFDFL